MDCTVKLYNLTTGREVKSFVGHGDGISSCCFAGKLRLCSASLDGKLSLWEINEGHRVALIKRHNRQISSCAADPAGKLVVSVGWDSAMFVWNAKDGKQVSELKGEQRPINCVAFHPEGQFIVTGSWDASLKIWDTLNRKKIKTMKGHKSAVRAVVYSPTSRHIASASLDGEVKLWSSESGTQVGSISRHSMPINQLCFTHLGHHLVTVSDDHLVKVWSGQLGKPTNSIMSDVMLGEIQCLSISPDGQFIGIGYHEKSIRVCTVEHGAEVCLLANIHDASIQCITWSSDGQSLVSGSDDNTLKIFNVRHLPKVNQLFTLTGHEKGVWCVAWQMQFVASGSEDFTINVYSISKSRKARVKSSRAHIVDSLAPWKTLKLHTAPVTGLCFTSDGKRLISCSRDRSVVLWNLYGEGKVEKVLQECHKDWISACVLAENDSYLVTASNDFTLKVWSLATYTEKAVFTGHVGAINSVAIMAGCIVSASVDGTVKVWSHRGVEITTLHGNGQRVNACTVYIPENKEKSEELSTSWSEMVQDATDLEEKLKPKDFDLEGVLVASGGDDGTVRFWKALQGNELCSLMGHSDRVISVATNGTDIITSALDNTVKIWSPKVEVSAISPICHNATVTSVVMSNCTNWALSSSRDGCVTIWRLSTDSSLSLHIAKQCNFKAHLKAVNAVCCLSPSSATDIRFATCGDDGTVALWSHDVSKCNVHVPTMTDKQTHNSKSSPVTCLAYNEEATYLVSGGWDGVVCGWIIKHSKAQLANKSTGSLEWILCVTFLNPTRVICSTAGNQIVLWDIKQDISQDLPVHVELDNKNSNSNKQWPTALCVHGSGAREALLLVGDSKGVLSVRDSSGNELKSKKVRNKSL
jgi:telomerase protein component 1